MERKSSHMMNRSNQNIIKTFYHKPYTIGIEEEYMICNPSSGNLTNKANQIMNNLDSELENRFSYELNFTRLGSFFSSSYARQKNQFI